MEFCEGLDPHPESVEYERADGHRLDGSPGVAAFQVAEGAWPEEHWRTHGGAHMAARRFLRLTWWAGMLCVVGLCLAAAAQQGAAKSDADPGRGGPAAPATAHGEKPRYGGKFISAGNEVIPLFDMHQTSFGGVYAATAPAYNCLIRTSPYDPLALDIIPELADSWDISDGGKTVTFHLHKGVKWHDGVPFSSADV